MTGAQSDIRMASVRQQVDDKIIPRDSLEKR